MLEPGNVYFSPKILTRSSFSAVWLRARRFDGPALDSFRTFRALRVGNVLRDPPMIVSSGFFMKCGSLR